MALSVQESKSPVAEVRALDEQTFRTSVTTSRGSPLALRFPFLVALNALVFLICVAIVIAWHLSSVHDGFHIRAENRYLLTYGPTTILICLVAAWRQLDYHTKTIVPWYELWSGFSQASRSVLLDYVSTFQLTAFWSAVRNRHVSVILTVSGFVALKIATLGSTGLLVVEPTNTSRDFNTSSTTAFGIENLDRYRDAAVFDQSLVYTTYGVLAQSLQKPSGLGEGVAYSTFDVPPGVPSDSVITGNVTAFVPTLLCKDASLVINGPATNSTDISPEADVQILSPSCSVRAQTVSINTLNPRIARCPPQQISGLFRTIDCDEKVFGVTDGAYKLIAVADLRYSQQLDQADADKELGTVVEANTWNTEIANVTAVVCHLSHVLQRHSLRANTTDILGSTLLEADKSTQSFQLKSFNDSDLDLLTRSAFSASPDILGNKLDGAYALEYPDTLFKMMAMIGDGTYSSLLDAVALKSSATVVIKQLSAQIAHQYLRVNASEPATLQVASLETHLKVTTPAAWLVFGALVVVLAITTIITTRRRRGSSYNPCDWPSSTVHLPPKNNILENELLKSQIYSVETVDIALRPLNVHLMRDQQHQAKVVLTGSTSFPEVIQPDQHWFSPITINKAAMIIYFACAAIVITSLEIVQRKSNQDHGIAAVESGDVGRVSIYMRLIPAFVALGLASAFNCIEFNVLLMAPFQRMTKSAPLTVLEERPLVGMMPILALWTSFRRKYWAAALSSVCALIGSLLTIAVSGLYFLQDVNTDSEITISQQDAFSPSWPNSAFNDNGTAIRLSLSENLNLPDIYGAFGEIALPAMTSASKLAADAPIEAKAEAWRAALECTTLDTSEFTVEPSQSRFQTTVLVNATYDLPQSCLLGGPDGNETQLVFDQSFNFPTNETQGYMGKLLDLHVGPYDPIMGDSQGETKPSANSNNPNGCPSLGLIYGFVDLATNSAADAKNNVVVEVCYQKLQVVPAHLTFTNASFAVNISVEALTDESSLRYIAVKDNITTETNVSSDATAFPYRLQNNFDNVFALFNTSVDNSFSRLSTSNPSVDQFFQGVLFGKKPMPLTTLQLSDKDAVKQMQAGILGLYRRYMAIAVSLNMRTSLPSEAGADRQLSSPSFSGKGHLRTIRVVQDATSKAVLQGMLAIMLVGGLIVVSTTRLYSVLPACANPCTIWGQWSLVAGSELVSKDKGLGWDSEVSHELQPMGDARSKINGKVRIKLGWWYIGDGRRRYGIDVVQDDPT